MRWERIRQMIKKEFLQIFRNPKMKAIIFVMPVIQCLVFGYAVTTDVNHIKLAVFDESKTPQSRFLSESFTRSGYFDLCASIDSNQAADQLLDRGKAAAILHIPGDYATLLQNGTGAPVQLLIDGSDSNTARVVLNYASSIAKTLNITIEEKEFNRAPTGQIVAAYRTWFNPNLTSRNFYVPGVIAIIVMLVSLLLTSMSVVREKEIGTIEQINVTPITPAEFILGKTMPSIVIGFLNMIFVTLISVFWFDIPVLGNVALLFLANGFFIMATIGIGLFISTVSSTQQQAMMSTFFFYFPAVLLSGFMFPINNMPFIVQLVTYLNPLRYFLIIIRGIFLKGIGLSVLYPQFIYLLILSCCVLYLAIKKFHKTAN